MSKTVVSTFGTFTDQELEVLKKGIAEISDIFTMQEAQRDALKEAIDHVYEELKIPKRIIRKIAKTYHKKDFQTVSTENEDFELLYVGVMEEND